METDYHIDAIRAELAFSHEAIGLAGITTTDKEQFVLKMFPLAEQAGKKFNLNPVIILAQAALESGWGTSYMARNNFNFFGITAFGKHNEYWNGQYYISKTSGLKFRVYPDPVAGFSDFARLITSKYKAAAAVSFDVAAYAKEIAYSPYIHESGGDSRTLYHSTIISNANAIQKIRQPGYVPLPVPKSTPTKTTTQQPATQKQNTPQNEKSGEGAAGWIIGLLAVGGIVWMVKKNSK
jgi:peptidoglycan hydrolase FlgJ